MDRDRFDARRAAGRRFRLVLLWYLAVGALLLLAAHQASAFGLFGYLALIACPLMYHLLHRGPGSATRGGSGRSRAGRDDRGGSP